MLSAVILQKTDSIIENLPDGYTIYVSSMYWVQLKFRAIWLDDITSFVPVLLTFREKKTKPKKKWQWNFVIKKKMKNLRIIIIILNVVINDIYFLWELYHYKFVLL